LRTLEHVHHLADEIGPRGSTTQSEQKAAWYSAEQLKGLKLEPKVEPFTSARSAYHPFALQSSVSLLSVILFWTAGSWGALIGFFLSLLALVAVILELNFRDNPLRWILPKGGSQNVSVRIEPEDEVKEHVVLIGHLDSHRTPIVFSSDKWLRIFGALIPLGLFAAIVLILIFGLVAFGLVSQTPVIVGLSVPCVILVVAVLFLMVQADRTPFTAGANDNATAVGVILSLTERLINKPLKHTAVWALLSGCEEVGCYGAEAFVRARQNELCKPIWITLDSVGGKETSIAYLTAETFLQTAKSDPNLLTLADNIADRRADLDAYRHHFKGAYTEGAIGAKHGFRVLTLLALTRQAGTLPEWHQLSDTFDKVDPQVVQRTEEFTWELLLAIDHQAG